MGGGCTNKAAEQLLYSPSHPRFREVSELECPSGTFTLKGRSPIGTFWARLRVAAMAERGQCQKVHL